MIDPKHCKGCKYARYYTGTTAYKLCTAYYDTHGQIRPTPDENGRCIHKCKAKAVSK